VDAIHPVVWVSLTVMFSWNATSQEGGMDNHFTEMCSGSEAGSCLRLIDSRVTQLKAPGPSRTCNESKEEACGSTLRLLSLRGLFFFFITLKPRVE